MDVAAVRQRIAADDAEQERIGPHSWPLKRVGVAQHCRSGHSRRRAEQEVASPPELPS